MENNSNQKFVLVQLSNGFVVRVPEDEIVSTIAELRDSE